MSEASAELEILRERGGWVDGRHALVWVRGPDATSFLEGLVSQSVVGLNGGDVAASFLLTPQGKMRALLWILKSANDSVGLITQATTASIVVEDLTRFRFRVNASIELEQRTTRTLLVPAPDLMAEAGIRETDEGWSVIGDGLSVRFDFAARALPRYLAVGTVAASAAQSLPGVSAEVYEALRVDAGEPLGTVDFDDSTIAHELGPVDYAVDFTKGCYLGQELIARIDSRGRVTRRLRMVSTAEAVQLAGAGLTRDGTEVGKVTSSAPNPHGQGTLGLALIRHEIEEGTNLEATVNGNVLEVTISAVPGRDT